MRHAAAPLPSCAKGGGGAAATAVARAGRCRPLISMPPLVPVLVDAAPLLFPQLPRSSSLRSCRCAAASPSREARSSSGKRDQARCSDSKDGRASRSSTPADDEKNRKPRLRALVVVEGPSDARAVLRAVDLSPGCHSLDGATWARNKGGMDALVEAGERALSGGEGERGKGKASATVVLLLDPDAPGRVARGEISRELCRRISSSLALYHAFIPPAQCTAARAVGGKSAGDIGIEHASASAVVAALRSARRHRGESSSEASSPAAPLLTFSMRELEDARLATSFDAGSQQQQKRKKKEGESGDAAAAASSSSSSPSSPYPSSSQKTSDRRRRFCDALGLGPCTGAQLLRALNEWGLTRADWEVGMRAAEEEEEGSS